MKVQKSFLFGIIWIDRKTARCPLAVAARKGLLQKPRVSRFLFVLVRCSCARLFFSRMGNDVQAGVVRVPLMSAHFVLQINTRKIKLRSHLLR